MSREIELSKGQLAIVDDEDYEWLTRWNWYAIPMRSGIEKFYAVRHQTKEEYASVKDSRLVYMHKVIITPPAGMKVDHINGNTVDNRRANLRVATHAENMRNSKSRKDNKSGYKGVSTNSNGKWSAFISVDGKTVYLGYFDTPEEAHEAYKAAAINYFGEYARFE